MTPELIPELLRKFSSQWLAVASSAEVSAKRTLHRTVLGVPVVLYRHAGGIAALMDRCPHRNVPLSAGKICGDVLQCSYHGWEFDARGQCVKVPGLSECPEHLSVKAFEAVEKNGLVWVCLDGAKMSAAPGLAGFAQSPFDLQFDSFLWSNEIECNFINGIENLLDPMHPAFVHAFLVRDSVARRATDVKVTRTETMLEVVYQENQTASGWIPRLFEGMRTESIGRYLPPFAAQLEYKSVKGTNFLLTTFFTPVSETRTRAFSFLSTRRGVMPAALKEAAMRVLFKPVLAQDERVLLLQQQNIERFGEADFVSTKLDIVRPHILHFLNNFESKKITEIERSLCIEI